MINENIMKLRKLKLFILMMFAMFMGLFISPYSVHAVTSMNPMEVHYIDVGQGDSTLIKSGDHAILIDAGDDSKGTAVQMYLKKQGVKALDYLVLTHPDADHIGGADVIVTKYDIKNIFMSSYTKDNRTYDDLINAIDNKGMKWSTPKVGSKYTFGDASFLIIAPNKKYDNPNDSSIGLIVKNGSNNFLFSGDAEEDAEKDILKNKLDISADVYKAGHHGSKTASSSAFLNAVDPTYAVISCGVNNSYGHPHSQTLNSLRAMGIAVFRTDEQGSVIATSDGKTIKWNCSPSTTWQAGEPTGTDTGTETEGVSSKSSKQSVEFTVAEAAAAVSVVETPTVETPVAEAPAASTGTTAAYICNTNTHKFHYPTCSSVGQMKDSNKLEVTCSRDELIGQEYVPCKRCNP